MIVVEMRVLSFRITQLDRYSYYIVVVLSANHYVTLTVKLTVTSAT